MKIYVDADACPVKDEVIAVGKKLNIPVFLVVDTSHILEDSYANTIIVDKGKDAVDLVLVNRVKKMDIVVTQDYGVATMALAKDAFALNQNGLYYTKENIERLLFERHMSLQLRRAGKKNTKHKKRKKRDNVIFQKKFQDLCMKVIRLSTGE